MTIELHPQFKKSYKKRIATTPKLTKQVSIKLALFQKTPTHPLIKDHSLKGEKNDLRAFSITGDIRIVYKKISASHILLLDIGTHNQVY